VKLYVSAACHIGSVRQNNEDMVLVGDQFLRNTDSTEETNLLQNGRYLVALADGMGGHNKGEVASSEVLTNLHYYFYDLPAELSVTDFNEAIFEWMESINYIIDSKGHSDPQFHDMGTTLVGLAYYCGEFYWMNCGDSRIYYLHEGQLVQLSIDHSLNTLMGVTEHSNIITNCIGGGCTTSFIDLVNCTDNIQSGDTLMLCSDGLTDMISDDEIQDLINEGADARRLTDVANAAGGFDNISVCLIKVV